MITKGYIKNIDIFSSKDKHYRTRAEFSIFHDENANYAMFDQNTKKKYIIDSFDIADEKICSLMPILLKHINKNQNLKNKLFGVEFLATKLDISVTLLYHKDILEIKNELNSLSDELNLKIIARSKNKKLIFKDEILKQELNIFDKKIYYLFNNDCFIQPNTYINEQMIQWVINNIKNQNKKDLLELYCGYGNFTIALSFYFNKVLATEISKSNINFALKNCDLNNINNINFARLSSDELSKAIKKDRKFNRLKYLNLDDFNFSHVLVDPPRAGLQKSVVEFIKNYENIIYISCNPHTLKQNLKELTKTHNVINFAFFDQFVNTHHMECGVILNAK